MRRGMYRHRHQPQISEEGHRLGGQFSTDGTDGVSQDLLYLALKRAIHCWVRRLSREPRTQRWQLYPSFHMDKGQNKVKWQALLFPALTQAGVGWEGERRDEWGAPSSSVP